MEASRTSRVRATERLLCPLERYGILGYRATIFPSESGSISRSQAVPPKGGVGEVRPPLFGQELLDEIKSRNKDNEVLRAIKTTGKSSVAKPYRHQIPKSVWEPP